MATVRTNHHAAVLLVKCGSPLPECCTIQPSSKKLYDTSVVIVVCAPSGVSTQVRLSGIGANAEIGGETYISRVKIGCMEATYAVIGVWHKRLYAGSIFHNSIQLFCA